MDRHPTLVLGSVAEISLRGRLEPVARTATPDEGRVRPEFGWRSRRIELEGTIFRKLEFDLSRELGDVDAPERDAFVNLNVTQPFELRAGRFKVPFGREVLTSGANIDFVRRSLAAQTLSPGRDVGVMVHGRPAGRAITYQIGFFTHDGDNARTGHTEGAQQAFAGRLVVAPFASGSDATLGRLELGVAAVRSHLNGQLGLRGRTVFGEGVFFDRVHANGLRLRRGLEAAWVRGPFSVSGEYIDTSDERDAMGFTNEDLPAVRARGWYLTGTWLVTGEDKRAGLDPRRSALRGGIGAIEVAVRFERLGFETVAYPGASFGFPPPDSLLRNGERVTTVGVTWYLNRYVKARGNLVREAVDDPQRSPAPRANGRFSSGVLLLQFVL
jgi:phosphate-selective porin OprO/OprP